MNKIFTRLNPGLLAVPLLLAGSVGYAQNEKGFSLEVQHADFTLVNFDNPAFIQHDINVNGATMTELLTAEGAPNMEAGAPNVPHYAQSIVIPNEGNTTLQVTFSDFYEIHNVDLAPSKGNLYRNINPADVPYQFGSAYSTDDFYPGTLADMSSPYILRDYRAQTIITHPFQYNPVTKTLRVYEDLQVVVMNHPDEIGMNELTMIPARTSTYENVYAHHFLNYDELPQSKYSIVEEEGSCLVIGPSSLQEGIDQIVEWKVRLGIPCESVDVATIGNTDTQIKAYIENYYASNPDLVFVILVGDHQQVKSHTYGTSGWGEQKWSDSYYGQMTSDFYPELFVGRYSATNNSQLQTMIDRQVEYELDPLPGDHWSTAIGIGSDEGAGIGDDGEADWQHLRNIRDELMAFGFTEVHEFYDGSHGGADANGSPNASMVQTAMNNGATLFNYTGHGAQNVCVTSNYGSGDINSANNNGKYPFVISVACNNGTFTSGTCLTEDFIRASNGSGPTGAIAACGSSILMSWAPPMETQDEMSKILTEQYSGNKKVTLGGLFYNAQMSCIDDHGSGGEEVMQTWVFFGDPAVMIRTDDPTNMAVNHLSWVPMGETSLNVNCDIDGADITVSQAGEIIGTGVSSGGSALITFNNALTIDDYLVVTATKYNHDGYVGNVQVGNGTAGIEDNAEFDLAVFPNPAKESAFVSLSLNETAMVNITLTDLSGKVVAEIANRQLSSGQQQFEIATDWLQSGMYFIKVNVNNSNTVEKLTVIK